MKTSCRIVFPLLLLVLASGCANMMTADFDDPEVEVVGLEPMRSNGLEARFKVSLRVTNPNSIGLDLDGVLYELYVEGSKLLSGVSSRPVKLPAYGEAILELEAGASMLGSFSLIQKLLSKPPENGIAYELRAKLSLANWPGSIRILREGRIGVPPAAVQKT